MFLSCASFTTATCCLDTVEFLPKLITYGSWRRWVYDRLKHQWSQFRALFLSFCYYQCRCRHLCFHESFSCNFTDWKWEWKNQTDVSDENEFHFPTALRILQSIGPLKKELVLTLVFHSELTSFFQCRNYFVLGHFDFPSKYEVYHFQLDRTSSLLFGGWRCHCKNNKICTSQCGRFFLIKLITRNMSELRELLGRNWIFTNMQSVFLELVFRTY